MGSTSDAHPAATAKLSPAGRSLRHFDCDCTRRGVVVSAWQSRPVTLRAIQSSGPNNPEPAARRRPDHLHRSHGNARQSHLLSRGTHANAFARRRPWHHALRQPLPARSLLQSAAAAAPSGTGPLLRMASHASFIERKAATALLLLAPFAILAFLANVVNLQVEEGYAYSLLALAVAILLLRNQPNVLAAQSWRLRANAAVRARRWTASIWPKARWLRPSSCCWLGYLLLERRTALRLLVLVLTMSAPIGWALHQHHASGRYSIGTSLRRHQSAQRQQCRLSRTLSSAPGDTLDRFDSQTEPGLHFSDEWSFNDYHQHAALEYLRTHPRQTLRGDCAS